MSDVDRKERHRQVGTFSAHGRPTALFGDQSASDPPMLTKIERITRRYSSQYGPGWVKYGL